MNPFENLITVPPGAKFVRVGMAGVNDFELYGDKIVKGPRGSSQVIVAPAPGYEFAFDIASNAYAPRLIGMTAPRATITFDISDPANAAFVKGISQHASVISGGISSAPPTAAQAVSGSQVQIVDEPKQLAPVEETK